MKTQTEIFAHNLKVLLEKKHKSQSDLARFLKVTPTTVSRWANAEALPRSPMIDRICGFLVCTTEDLMVDHTRQANLLKVTMKPKQKKTTPRSTGIVLKGLMICTFLAIFPRKNTQPSLQFCRSRLPNVLKTHLLNRKILRLIGKIYTVN